MTTTAYDDQFTEATKTVHQQYDTASILRRNVAELEMALKRQTERADTALAELEAIRDDNHSMMGEILSLRKRAEMAESELDRLREQKPDLFMAFSKCDQHISFWTRCEINLSATMRAHPEMQFSAYYARPVVLGDAK